MQNNIKVNVTVRIESRVLIIEKDGNVFQFDIKNISDKLSSATDGLLNQFTVSPSGYGIHWDLIDEDISIPALLNEPFESYGNKKPG